MKEKLLIVGASGHGKVVADIAIKMNIWRDIAFLDDDETINTCMGIEIIGKTKDAIIYRAEADFFVAIGDNYVRENIQEELEKKGFSIATLIHPDAVIADDVVLGMGTVIMAGVVINSSSKIGKGCIINTSSSIDHDNVIEDYIHISPGVHLAGTVKIGRNNWIGVGSAVSNNVKICSGCIVGAGAVVVKDITEPGTYIGVPARRLVK